MGLPPQTKNEFSNNIFYVEIFIEKKVDAFV